MGEGARRLLVREKELTRLEGLGQRRAAAPADGGDHRALHFDTETARITAGSVRRTQAADHPALHVRPRLGRGCDGCSLMADHIGPLSHLHAKDTSFVLVSRAALTKLLAFRDRMGWKLPWVSSAPSTFNEDFGATVDGEEVHSVSVFLRDGDRVFHTWQTFNRGEEPFMVVFDLLDLTPYGRQESWEDSPDGWPQQPPYEWMRLHDSY